jgi:hypothetical protein
MNASDVKTFFEAAAGDWDTMRLTYCHLPSHPRNAGASAPRPRCSWHPQSRCLVTKHSLPVATDRAMPVYAYTGRGPVAAITTARQRWRVIQTLAAGPRADGAESVSDGSFAQRECA